MYERISLSAVNYNREKAGCAGFCFEGATHLLDGAPRGGCQGLGSLGATRRHDLFADPLLKDWRSRPSISREATLNLACTVDTLRNGILTRQPSKGHNC